MGVKALRNLNEKPLNLLNNAGQKRMLNCYEIFLLIKTYLGASFIKASLPKSSPSFKVATVPFPWRTEKKQDSNI